MYCLMYWRSYFLVIWPCISLVLTFVIHPDTPATRCGFVVILMAGYWVSECIPLGVTGLIPLFSFPMLGIMDSKETSKQYMSDANQLLFGGLIVAISIEYCNLHKRIAVLIVSWVGCKHLWLTFGLFFCTMFVSMWITNVATVAMIAPITQAILEELEVENLLHVYEDLGGNPIIPTDVQPAPLPRSQTLPSKTTICYFLGITWSATIGGIGTLTGTGTNLTVKGIYESIAQNYTGNVSHVFDVQEISFVNWMLFNTPHMLVSNFLVWLSLNIIFLGLFINILIDEDVKNNKYVDKEEMSERLTLARARFKIRLHDMGSMTWHEKTVGLLFLLAVCLWVFRKPGFIKGWAWNNMITDTTPVFMIVLLLFMLPEKLDFFTKCGKEERSTEPGKSCITWPVVNQKMPWGILFLLGGGFALSRGIKTSGLDIVIADALSVLNSWHDFLVMVFVCTITTCFTEFTSNVAVANIMMPIVIQLAQNLNVNAIYLVIPVGVCCSFSFMLPTGTPSNALVLGMTNMPTKYMFVAGIVPKLVTLGSVVGCVVTFGKLVYGF